MFRIDKVMRKAQEEYDKRRNKMKLTKKEQLRKAFKTIINKELYAKYNYIFPTTYKKDVILDNTVNLLLREVSIRTILRTR